LNNSENNRSRDSAPAAPAVISFLSIKLHTGSVSQLTTTFIDMQKKISTALLWSALLLVTIAPFTSCVQNSKPSEPAADLSFRDTPFVQETHTAFQVGTDKLTNEIRGIAVDHEQNVWITTADGVFQKAGNSAAWEPVITSADRGPAYAVAVKADGTILLGTWNGLYTYQEGVLRKEAGPMRSVLTGFGI
jgi:hypothetical protein